MTRHILCCVLFSLAGLAGARAQEALPEQSVEQAVVLFDAGTREMTAGRYLEAIALYDEARQTGFVSPELLYNTGIAWYRLDEIGRSILFLKRAARLDPENERIRHSLSIAEDKRTDSFSTLPVPFWKRAHQWITEIAPLGLLFGIGAGLLAIWAVLSGWLALNPDRAPVAAHVKPWLITAALPLMVFALVSSMYPPHPVEAVVLAEAVTLTEQATSDSTPLEEVHEGTTLFIRTAVDNWVLVRLPNGLEGWLPAQAIEAVSP